MRPIALLWIWSIVAANTAWAQAPRESHVSEDPPGQPRSDFWHGVVDPAHARARILLRHARHRLAEVDNAPPGMGPAERRSALEGAIERLQLAHRMAPTDAEILYLLASTTARWTKRAPGGGEERLDDRAVELFHRLRSLDPEFAPDDVAFQLGVLHTRQRRFQKAAAEYQRSVEHELMLGTSPTAVSNLAEVTMLAGDLPEAVRHFERAISMQRRLGAGSELPLFGLAVALDRLGEHRAAIDRVREAVSQGGGDLSRLRGDGVFYEPPYEVYWYEALGHEALAELSTSEGEARARYRLALDSYQAFIDASDGESPWEPIAQRHAEQLTIRLGR